MLMYYAYSSFHLSILRSDAGLLFPTVKCFRAVHKSRVTHIREYTVSDHTSEVHKTYLGHFLPALCTFALGRTVSVNHDCVAICECRLRDRQVILCTASLIIT